MIELIYNEEEKYTAEEKHLGEPKNVKQIGEPREYKKIFIEDYVHTFLLQICKEQADDGKVAILFGQTKRSGGMRHIYVKSALPVDGVVQKQGKYLFSEKLWGDIYVQGEKYFPEQEILGWFLAKPGFAVEKTVVIEETHRTYFSGAEKVLFMLEPLEEETAFFGFDGNRFSKQPGYYIYYEKNEPMHEYLVEENSRKACEKKEEKPDVAVASFRKLLKEKQANHAKRKKMVVSYGMKVSIALVLFVGAVTLKNQTEKIRTMEAQMFRMSESEPIQAVSGTDVIVEELPGEVQEIPPEELVEEPVEIPVTEVQEPEEVTVTEPETPEEVPEGPESYIIQPGDSLAKISREKYGTDDMVDEICTLNEIANGDYIQVGETILLP